MAPVCPKNSKTSCRSSLNGLLISGQPNSIWTVHWKKTPNSLTFSASQTQKYDSESVRKGWERTLGRNFGAKVQTNQALFSAQSIKMLGITICHPQLSVTIYSCLLKYPSIQYDCAISMAMQRWDSPARLSNSLLAFPLHWSQMNSVHLIIASFDRFL